MGFSSLVSGSSIGKIQQLRAEVIWMDNFGFQGVHIYNIRAEDAAKDSKFREKYDFVTARAVARMNTLCEYCLPFAKVGGAFVAYKSGDTSEIFEAEILRKAVSVVEGCEFSAVFAGDIPTVGG